MNQFGEIPVQIGIESSNVVLNPANDLLVASAPSGHAADNVHLGGG